MTGPFPPTLKVASVSLLELVAGKIHDHIPRGRWRLPEYQRPYRWSSEQVAQLADDLAPHLERAWGHDYYLGSLILHQSDNGWLNIIDGLRRLKTMNDNNRLLLEFWFLLGSRCQWTPSPSLSRMRPRNVSAGDHKLICRDHCQEGSIQSSSRLCPETISPT
ncbi:hypothetical protein CIC12_21305 [Burkholderia sp. SG-MS1]|uniref:DUF262 domain-containing protein n=1 Tax=Paraburkholderia sp. SG-MS1 TaxID=2023741 RepID=UPI0014466325|nr:DUF262 domain-containing protein [Paraburkholderia sp. SG-MS1]NKJ49224.1 hypothetical protein [Paraburkholderia sp. SG-MS1]